MIEQVEALHQHFQLPHPTQVEFLAHPHVGFPCSRIAVSVASDTVEVAIAPHAVNPVVAARSVHPRSKTNDRSARRLVELLCERTRRPHGVWQPAMELPNA